MTRRRRREENPVPGGIAGPVGYGFDARLTTLLCKNKSVAKSELAELPEVGEAQKDCCTDEAANVDMMAVSYSVA